MKTNERFHIACQNTFIISHSNDLETMKIWKNLKELHDENLDEFFEFSIVRDNEVLLETLRLPSDPSLYEWFVGQPNVPLPTKKEAF
ncbi:hypothetical protein [Gluconobacter sp. P1D12_c]|nr:hypothetical protein [Gluconobacter sp. P1D12_c]